MRNARIASTGSRPELKLRSATVQLGFIPRQVQLATGLFRESLRGSAVEVRSEPWSDPELVVRLRVVNFRPAEHTVAIFEASDPEYVSLVLDNGVLFWENEWDVSFQPELARDFGKVVAQHLRGAGVFGGSTTYEVIVNGESSRSQGLIAAVELRERFAATSGGNPEGLGQPKTAD